MTNSDIAHRRYSCLDLGEDSIVLALVYAPRPAHEFEGREGFARLVDRGLVKICEGMASFELERFLELEREHAS